MTQNGQYPTVKFNIHGIVMVEFVNASAKLAAAFRERLAPILHQETTGSADIVVAFQEQLSPAGLRYVGQNMAAFDDQGFYVLDPVSGAVQARMPLEEIGQRPRIICRSDVKSVPLLDEIVNLACVQKGYVPVHAAGFVYDGAGIMVMGWPKGGKTGAMLAFMNHGAEFIGDEWLWLAPGGRAMLGLPSAVSLSEWQLAQLPGLAPKTSASQKAMFKGIHGLDWLHGKLIGGPFKLSYATKMLGKALPAFKRQLKIYRSSQKLFKNQIGDLRAPVDKIFWIVGHDTARIDIKRGDPEEIARRMAAANEYEQRPFWNTYQAFRYAFPNRRNDCLTDARARQRALLTGALDGSAVFELAHPYGGSLEDLFKKMSPYCTSFIEETIAANDKPEPVY